jgi:ABC-2 type transport system ATP-binding protein
VLLTTHYLDEAEHLADRVGVLAAGRLVAEGAPEELIRQRSGTVVRFWLPSKVAPADAASTFAPLLDADVRLSGPLVEATLEHPTAAVHRLTGWAVEAGVELESLSLHRASLEDVYLGLVAEQVEGTEAPAPRDTTDTTGERSAGGPRHGSGEPGR